jgi:hypothetical protein
MHLSHLVWALITPCENVGAGVSIKSIRKTTHNTLLDKITCAATMMCDESVSYIVH